MATRLRDCSEVILFFAIYKTCMIFSVLGEKGLAKEFGKKGTSTDITLYNARRDSFVEPETYPDKVQSLYTAVAMSDAVILYLTPKAMNFQLAETLLLIDFLKKDKGIIVLEGVVREQVEPLLKGNVASTYEFMENDVPKLIDKTKELSAQKSEGDPMVVIDHSFNVKSVGFVVLGYLKQGTIKKYDKLMLHPAEKEVTIKSIQIHDKEYEGANAGDRVGLSLKGTDENECSRGSVIGKAKSASEFKIEFRKNPFYQDEVPKKVMVGLGLQYVQGEFENSTVKTEKGLAYNDDDMVVVFDPGKKQRIVGAGIIVS